VMAGSAANFAEDPKSGAFAPRPGADVKVTLIEADPVKRVTRFELAG
jgi:hypothetical protein